MRNPLRYGRLVEIGQEFFGRHPLYDDRGQPINVPDWSFPGRGRVQRQLKRADSVMTAAERFLTALPIRGKQAQLAARIEERHALAQRALGYVTLYGAYTETDARYRVDHLLELWAACDEADHERFAFDPGGIDWSDYVYNVHLPSVLEHTCACAPSRANRWWTSGPTVNARPSWRRSGTWPCSTSSTP